MNNRKEMRKKAKSHTKEMSKYFDNEIKNCIEQTVLYDNSNILQNEKGCIPECKVVPLDVVTAVFQCRFPGKICVLNFADFKKPGGMFLEGLSTQEESICHGSFLYNVLSSSELKCVYRQNRKCSNRSLYQNRALYTPDVKFFENDTLTKSCDVVTCAAPNFSSAHRFHCATKEENSRILRSRIKFVLNIMATQNVSCPILGAYGCGVFGQNPQEVAQIFKEELMSGCYPFKYVLFAILPRGSHGSEALEAFKRVFV